MDNQIQNKRVLISIGDASEYVGVSVDTLRRWEKKGRLEPYRSPGGHRYYEKDQLDSLFGKRYTRDEETQKHEKIEKEAEPVHVAPVEVPQTMAVHRLDPVVLEIRPSRPIDIPKLEPVQIQRREVIHEEKKVVTIVEEEAPPKPPPLLIPQVSLQKEVPQQHAMAPSKRNSKELVTTIIIVVILLLVIVLGIILFIMLARSQTVLSPSP